MRMQAKTKKKYIAALATATTLCLGFAFANQVRQEIAVAESGTEITVVGAAVRYPVATETVAEGTGLKFEVKVSNYSTDFGENLANVENLGVLINVEGVPDVENTPNGTVGANVKFIENSVASKDYTYEVKDDGLYMYVELKHVPANYFHHDFVCRAYYQLQGGDYAYSDPIERSAIYVINEALKDTSANAPSDTRKEELKGLKNASTDHKAASYGEVNEDETARGGTCECGKAMSVPIGKYTYVFDVDGGDEVDAIQAYSYDTVTLPEPTKADYKFLGWYLGEEKVETLTVPYENEGEKTVTLTAKWKALNVISVAELEAGYLFDGENKLDVLKVDTTKVKLSYSAEKNAMRAINVGGATQTVDVQIEEGTLYDGDQIVVEYYTDKDTGVSINGSWTCTMANNSASTDFAFAFVYTASGETTWNALRFSIYGANVDGLYIKSVNLIRKAGVSEEQLVNGYSFNREGSLLGKVTSDANITTSYDAEKDAMKVVNKSGNSSVYVDVDDVTLYAGDKIIITYYNTVKDADAYIVDTASTSAGLGKVYSASMADFGKHTKAITSETTISQFKFTIWGTTSTSALWIKSIQIIRKTSYDPITISEEELIKGYAFDSAEKVNGAATNGGGCDYHYNATENAMQVTQTATSGEERTLRFNFNVALKAKDILRVEYKAPDAGVSVRLNNVSKLELQKKSNYYVRDLEIPQDYTSEQGYMSLIYYTVGSYYIKSIQLIRYVEPPKLVENGQSEYVIVYPYVSGANQHQTAVKLLADYIQKATNASLTAVADNNYTYTDDSKVISLGDTKIAQQNGVAVTYEEFGKDGYYIKTVGDDLYIQGCTNNAIIFGAYDFLTYQFGIKFYSYDEIHIPAQDKVYLQDFDEKGIPSFEDRSMDLAYYNPDTFNADYEKMMKLNSGHGTAWITWSHNHFALMPKETYYAAHNDWYSPDKSQLCLTNDEMIAELCKNIQAKMASFDMTWTNEYNFMLGQEDAETFCTCARCTSEIARLGSKSAVMMQFINKVADIMNPYVEENYPGKKVYWITFAYHDTETPPAVKNADGSYSVTHEEVVAHENVGVLYAPIFFDHYHDVNDEGYNAQLKGDMLGWKATGARMYVWTYAAVYYSGFCFFDDYDTVQSTYQAFKDMGAVSVYTETDWRMGDPFHALSFYVRAKLKWDINADVDALIDEFITAYYHDAAPYMRQYFDDLRANNKRLDAEYEARGESFTLEVLRTDGYTTAEYWKKDWLLDKMSLLDEALAVVAQMEDKETSEKLRIRLQLEKTSLIFHLIQIYSDEFTAEELTAYIDAFEEYAQEGGLVRFKQRQEIQTVEQLLASWRNNLL